MRKLTLILTFLLFAGLTASAQMQISGTVTNAETGEPIPGVSVVVQSQTTIGTTTDMDGSYSLEVPSDAETLVFSFVGMQTKEVPINGRTTINVEMQPEVEEMEEVVVTALGISRERKSLGYSVQDVQSDELSDVPQDNVLNSLKGKVSGVDITRASGAIGASTRITVRGNSSFSNNQPLFVVDGTPISNYSNGASQWGGADYGNAMMDISPQDIESISILKGASATALYGSRAANGVVLITTKSGQEEGGLGISYNYSVGFSNPYVIPNYQNKYGQGFNGSEYLARGAIAEDLGMNPDNVNLHGEQQDAYNEYAINNSFAYGDGNPGGAGTLDYVDESWGPRLDMGLEIPQFTSPYEMVDGTPVYQPTRWVSHPNNVEKFFRTGINQSHNLSITGSRENLSGRLSVTQDENQGTVPNTDLSKTSVSLSTTLNLNDRFTAQAKANYVKNHSDNLPGQGYSASNIMQSLGSWFGRQVAMEPLQENWDEMNPWGLPYNWTRYYHDNPYWTVHKKPYPRTRDRFYGNIELKYQLTDWLNIAGRAGTDYFHQWRSHTIANMSNENKTEGGEFWEYYRSQRETNADVILNFNKELTDNITVDGLVGGHYRHYKHRTSGVNTDALTIPNFFHVSNVQGTPQPSMGYREREANGVYGQLNFSYGEWLFLGGTARNDWSSTLPPDNWSYFYPSGNLGIVFSEFIDSDVMSFGKFRSSYSVVGRATNPYQLYNNFHSGGTAYEGVSLYRYAHTLANRNLKPEKTNALEVGLNLKFFNNRLGFDISYYDRKTTNQIMAVDLVSSSGFNRRRINAGEIENEGVEVHAYGDIFKSQRGFNWRVSLNWSKNQNTVNKLYKDLESYQINSSWGGVTTEARPGKPLGVIRATGFKRDDQDRIIVNENCLPKPTASPINVGQFTPDWTGGITNTFRYNNWNLSVMFDGRKGGDIFSVTKMFGLYAGVLDETAAGDTRRKGLVAGQDVITDETFVKENGEINDIKVAPQDFWARFYNLKEHSVVDGSYIKLREVTLGYTFPQSMIQQTGFLQNLRISAYASNVALLYTHPSNDIVIDPETGYGTNIQGRGLEQYQIPPNRTFGFKISTQF